MKRRTDYQQAMNQELMRVYCEVAGKHECRGQYEAYEQTVRHPASRFYVSAKHAHRMIYPMLRGDASALEGMTDLKKQMYKDLLDVTLELSRRREFRGRSPYYILQFAVTRPAPRFYISAKRMSKIFTTETERRRCS